MDSVLASAVILPQVWFHHRGQGTCFTRGEEVNTSFLSLHVEGPAHAAFKLLLSDDAEGRLGCFLLSLVWSSPETTLGCKAQSSDKVSAWLTGAAAPKKAQEPLIYTRRQTKSSVYFQALNCLLAKCRPQNGWPLSWRNCENLLSSCASKANKQT